MQRLKKRLKLKIADIIDSIFPQACWAELVAWAIGYTSFTDTFLRGGWKRQNCVEGNYYCGKCKCKRKLRK